MIDIDRILLQVSVWIIPLLIAIPLHEAAHAWVANKFGDDTALRVGRMSLNPLKHIDPLGTLIMPGLLILFGAPFIFGYAKPVPINFAKLKKPKIHLMLVALAGPVANFLLAILGAIFLLIIGEPLSGFSEWLVITSYIFVHLNIILGVFNLLPVLPLDGGRILVGLLPSKISILYSATERYGLLLLLGLIFVLPIIGNQVGITLSPITWIVIPIVNWLESSLIYLIGLLF